MITKFLFLFYIISLGCAVPIGIGVKHAYQKNKLVWADSVNLLAAREQELACVLDNCITISESIGSGTSFVIDHMKDKSIVMTAAHLCQPRTDFGQSNVNVMGAELVTNFEIGLIWNRQLVLVDEVLYNNADNDICIVTIPRIQTAEAKIAKHNPDYGDIVWSIGAPAAYFPESAKPITHGHFSGEASRMLFDNSMMGFYNMSMPTVQGMSGSPIFNDKGEVVGIVSAVQADWHMICYSPTLEQIKVAINIAYEALESKD